MITINCEHPVIILNKDFVRNFPKVRHWSDLNGFHDSLYSRSQLELHFPYKKFYQYKLYVEKHPESIDNFFCFNEFGEITPMFLQVPCGKCPICKEKKSTDLAQRCCYESQLYDAPPSFLTLTYNNDHLPKNGVNKRDVQLFFKRLRRNIELSGNDYKIRYILVSEYGKKFKRPHYHAIVWNLPGNIFDQKKLVERSWQNGFTYCTVPVDGCASYCAKYIRKPQSVPYGKEPNFYLSSRRNGGIGAKFIDSFKSIFWQSHQVVVEYLDKWSGKVRKLYCTGYAKTRIFPTISKFFTYKEFRSLKVASGFSHLFDTRKRQYPYFAVTKRYITKEIKEIYNNPDQLAFCASRYVSAIKHIMSFKDKIKCWPEFEHHLKLYKATLQEYFQSKDPISVATNLLAARQNQERLVAISCDGQ